MWRQLFTAILLLVMFGATGEVAPISETAETVHFYLPLIEKSPPQIEIVVTDLKNLIMESGYNHISGYVRSQIPNTYYSVILEVEGTYTPNCDYDFPCDPYTVKIPITPALHATLPDQINPFWHDNLCYKVCTTYHNVRVASAIRVETNGVTYYPLTVVKWDYTAVNEYRGNLSGTIRNDSRETLKNLRLVVAELEKCGWRKAEIVDPILKPGRRTTFHLSYYYEDCLGDNLVIVGQGAAQP